MAEEMDYTPDLYTLVDEDGEEKTFEMLDVLEVDDERYFALTAYNEDPEAALNDDGEVIILKSVYEGDEEIMVSIDNEEEYDKIGRMFMKRLEELYDFETEDSCSCGECDCDHE